MEDAEQREAGIREKLNWWRLAATFLSNQRLELQAPHTIGFLSRQVDRVGTSDKFP